MSYQSLRDAISGQGKHAEGSETDQADATVPEPDGTQSDQRQRRRGDSERHNTTHWLYELVFSSYAESLSGSLPPTSKSTNHGAEAEGPDGPNHANGVSSTEPLAPLSSTPDHMQLAAMIQTPVEVPSVVDELLAEWTTLTEDEIAGVVEAGSGRFEPEVPIAMIKVKDAIGRRFYFPYQQCRTWAVSDGIQTPLTFAR